jgi:hypothetical protein
MGYVKAGISYELIAVKLVWPERMLPQEMAVEVTSLA